MWGDENEGQSRPQFHTDTFQPTMSITMNIHRFIQRGTKRLTELLWNSSVLTFWAKWIFFSPLILRPNANNGLLFIELCKSHTNTYKHTHTQSIGLHWMSDQLVMETSTSQHTILTTGMYGQGGIRTRSLSRRVAADVRLRPHGIYIHSFI
jgi:hypothetical protein